MSALLEHASVVGATFVRRWCLVDLHLLDPAEGVLCSRIAAPRALSARNEILSSSGRTVTASRQTVTESLRVKVSRGVVHVLAASAILARTHQLIVDASRTSTSSAACTMAALVATFSFFINHGHPVEVVLSKVKVLARLVLHILALVVVDRQLLDFKTVLIIYLVSHATRMCKRSLRLPAGLAVIVV